MEKIIRISPKDNVAVAVQRLAAKEPVIEGGIRLTAENEIPFGHKIALADIRKGEPVVKYGYPIGHATGDIRKGEHVHIHNLRTNLSETPEYAYQPVKREQRTAEPAAFQGYRRRDGRVGIRNEIWIVPTVGCVNKTAERIALVANQKFGGMCDGIYTFPHPYGCSQMGDDQTATQNILAGLADHPNAAGVLILGLGCENNNIEVFRRYLKNFDEERVKFLAVQESDNETEDALGLLGQIARAARHDRRQTISADRLVVGLKCGGSDAFSGITANPLFGLIADRITACGGKVLLTEVPEMFGAEHLLMQRCIDQRVYRGTVGLIENFKAYYRRYNQVVYENPSPGNKDGGITTLEEKSLGCVQKGGHAPVSDVIDYGGRCEKRGISLLNGPGNDMVSCTNLTAAGAHIILFSTGRGTPFGAPVPTVKVSSNTQLFVKKPAWIDYDAGKILTGRSFEDAAAELYALVLDIASGKSKTKNEQNGYREIAIFKDGVTL